MGMGRKAENYSRRLIVILLLCLIYFDVWDLFIYLLLSFALLSYLFYRPFSLYRQSHSSSLIMVRISDFGFRSYIFYFSLRSGGGSLIISSSISLGSRILLSFYAFGVNW